MRVEMTVDTDGVKTTVAREYEPNIMYDHPRPPDGAAVPSLEDVTQAVAAAATIAHLITPKESTAWTA